MPKSKFYPFNDYEINYENHGICSICDGHMFHGIRLEKNCPIILFETWREFNICGECYLKIKEVYDRT